MQQHQQKRFDVALDKTDEFGRYSSPLCRHGERYLGKKNMCGCSVPQMVNFNFVGGFFYPKIVT